MDYIKVKNWNGKDLTGMWELCIKIDGVRMLRDENGNPVSRAGKPLYGLQNVPKDIVDAEVYLGSWGESVSAVRTMDAPPVDIDNVFPLFPVMDDRLSIGHLNNPRADYILGTMELIVAEGCEGLILRESGGKKRVLRVKPKETFDEVVIGYQEGTGKHAGRMGALVTSRGKVGTGFTDKERIDYHNKFIQGVLIGAITIEVECMELTDDGMFRHPRFMRERFDK